MLLEFLQPPSSLPDAVVHIHRTGVPEGTIVKFVFPDPARNAIAVVIEHPSFDAIPESQMLPEHDSEIWWTHTAYKVIKDNPR